MSEKVPSTKFPFFNTTVQTSSGDIGSYHEAHLYSLSLGWNVSQIVQNFALFVASLTGEEDVSFLADIESCDQEKVSTLADLKFTIQILTGSTPSGKHVDQNKIRSLEADHLSNPLILVVDKHPHDSLVDLTLSLRGDHGPAVAASTLVQLAAHYLALPSASTSLDTESNLEGTELLPAPSQLNFPPMPASPVPAHLSTAVDFQQPREPVLLHTAFEKRVSQTPNALAVDYLFTSCDVDQSVAHRTLTYEEVKFQAVSVAHYVNLLVQELHWKATWGKQRVIPVLLPPCPELYICVLGILKAGHAFCPLPLDAPVQRIRDILDDIQAPAILGLGTSPWINPEIKPSHSPDCPPGREMVWVDILNMQDWEAKTSNIMRPVDPKGPYHVPTAENALAYVLYTSGSTGKPKGVLVSHHSVVCAISSYVSHMPHLPTGSQLRWFQMTSPTFGIFLLDMFLPLGLGGTLCTAERVMILTDVETAVDKLQALATFSIASFAMLFRPDRMPLLKTVVSGGETLNRRVIENYSKDCNLEQDRFLLNIHGPTECTISVTSENFSIHTRASIIGDLVSTASAFIIDPRSPQPKVLPLGLPGELAIGGPQVSLGYLNRVQETAKAFITDPNFGRLYRTGDKARVVWTEDGQPKLEYLGRLNADQVKLNGRRVELGEIEAVVAKAQVVSEVAVMVSSTQIIACVITRSPYTPEGTESHCREVALVHLPPWMHPSKYLFWECLPRTASGKVDRKTIALRVEEEMLLRESLAAKVQMGSKEVGPDELKVEDHRSWQLTPGIGVDSTRGSDVIDTMDVRSIVYQCLAAAINSDVGNCDGCMPLFQLGVDSLRSILFLQVVRDHGVHELKIQDMLSGNTIDGLVHLVEERRQNVNQNGVSIKIVPGKVFEKAVPCAPEITEAELFAIDDDVLWEHPVQTRLLQFETECRPLCLRALNIPAQDIEQVLPTTSLHSRMIDSFVELDEDVNQHVEYRQIEYLVYRVPDSLQPEKLQKAVCTVLKRHDCFRTVFPKVDHALSTFAQVILFPSSPAALIPTVEIICNQYDKSPNSLWRHTVNNAQRSAEVALGLGRVGVVASYVLTPDHEHCVMILTLFHPVYDGVSLMYLREDIANEYHQPGTVPRLQRLSIRKPVELNLETDWLEINMFWMRRYGGVPPFRIGPKYPKTIHSMTKAVSETTSATNLQCAFRTLQLSMKELTAKAAMNLSTTPVAVIQGAWAMTLASTMELDANTSALNIQFGNILHGRHSAEAQQCMGPMVATVPLRVVFPDRLIHTAQLLLKQTAKYVGLSWSNMPNRFLSSRFPSLAFANAPLPFDTVLVLQNFEGHLDRDLPGFNRQDNLLAPYKELDIGVPILIEVWPGYEDVTKNLVLKCSYNTRCTGYEFMSAEWINSILEKMEELLVWIVNNPGAYFDVHGNQDLYDSSPLKS